MIHNQTSAVFFFLPPKCNTHLMCCRGHVCQGFSVFPSGNVSALALKHIDPYCTTFTTCSGVLRAEPADASGGLDWETNLHHTIYFSCLVFFPLVMLCFKGNIQRRVFFFCCAEKCHSSRACLKAVSSGCRRWRREWKCWITLLNPSITYNVFTFWFLQRFLLKIHIFKAILKPRYSHTEKLGSY